MVGIPEKFPYFVRILKDFLAVEINLKSLRKTYAVECLIVAVVTVAIFPILGNSVAQLFDLPRRYMQMLFLIPSVGFVVWWAFEKYRSGQLKYSAHGKWEWLQGASFFRTSF